MATKQDPEPAKPVSKQALLVAMAEAQGTTLELLPGIAKRLGIFPSTQR